MNQPSPTILLVEDSNDDVFIMQRALKQAAISYPVQVLTDGQQARAYLDGQGEYSDRQRFPLPFLLFLDLKLPYLNGFEILSWMREQPELHYILVVVLTGSAEPKDQDRAQALGARSYLVKPPTPQILTDLFRSLNSHSPNSPIQNQPRHS